MYDVVGKKLFADLSRSSQLRNIKKNPLSGTDKRSDVIQHFDAKDNKLKLHIFIDKALIQAYANDQKTITSWSYPSREDAKGIQLWSDGGDVKIKSMEIWEMKSIYY